MTRRLALAVALAALLPACGGGQPSEEPTESPTPPPSPSPAFTSPSPARPDELVFAVKGDWGAGTAAQAEVTARMCRVRARTGFRLVVTTGDNFYDPDGVARTHNYYDPERCLIAADRHRWRATWGNHDVFGGSTERVLGARNWYRWTARGVDFFALDSNKAESAEQRDWLRARLSRSDAPVKVVVFHHPPFTVGAQHTDDERVKANWVPLFERFDVTLVLTGHQHDYEHSRVRGVDYVVSGGGGGPLYACVRTPPTLIECRSEHHFLLVRVSETTVRVRAIRPDGSTLDRFSIRA